VAATRFPPDGVRSYGPIARFLPRDPATLAGRALLLPMIETASGLAAVEKILAVPGIDGVYVGPADLGISLGLGPAQFPASTELEPALGTLAKAARSAGKIAGIHAGSEHFVERYAQLGFRLMTMGTESSLVASGVNQALQVTGRSPATAAEAASPY
jgi:2-dehydro-3-deoxyglucarate aldolase